MNVTLSDIKLKKFLKNKVGLDLTNGIEMITNYYDLPMEFERRLNPDALRRYLNRFGPFYYLKGKKKNYLIQERDNGWFCFDEREEQYDLSEVYEDVGIPNYLGMKPNELYNLYGPEE